MPGVLRLNLRKQELLLDENGYRKWQVIESPLYIPSELVALVLCDVWEHHWCRGAEERLEKMLPRMNTVVKAARQAGTLIVHAPSETMDFYKGTPARFRVLTITPIEPPEDKDMQEPTLPVDAADGGCDTVNNYAGVDKQVWTQQHPAIEIDQELDAITDNGRELYSLIQQKGIQQLIILGVHTNMCILNRSFAIKQMVKWGQNIALMRDLTDAMYNPTSAPYVSHTQGTQLVIYFIEKHWCPTLSSTDLLPIT